MTPVPIQPIFVLPGSALLIVMIPSAVCVSGVRLPPIVFLGDGFGNGRWLRRVACDNQPLTPTRTTDSLARSATRAHLPGTQPALLPPDRSEQRPGALAGGPAWTPSAGGRLRHRHRTLRHPAVAVGRSVSTGHL